MKLTNKKIGILMLGLASCGIFSLDAMKSTNVPRQKIFYNYITNKAGYKCSQLYKAIKAGDMKFVKNLVQSDAHIEYVVIDSKGEKMVSALGLAIECNNLLMVQYFVEQRADLEFVTLSPESLMKKSAIVCAEEMQMYFPFDRLEESTKIITFLKKAVASKKQ